MNTEELKIMSWLQRKNNRTEHFGKEKIILLIKEIETRPILWDITHEQYLNKQLVKATWESVGAEINKAGDDCQTVWESLKDSFQYHRSKQLKKAAGSRGDVEWQYAKHMAFLPHVSTERLSMNIFPQSSECPETIECTVKLEPLLDSTEYNISNDVVNEQLETSAYTFQSPKRPNIEGPNYSQQIVELIGELVQERKQNRAPRPALAYWEDLLNDLPAEQQREVEQKITMLLHDCVARNTNK